MKNIIFICGAGGVPAATYSLALKRFCEDLGYKFYFPEMPGFDEEITYEKYKIKFEESLKQVKPEETTVIAQSAGNWFFVKYMFNKNIRFDSFISVATGASGLDKPAESTVIERLKSITNEFLPSLEECSYFRTLSFNNKAFLYGGKDKFFTRDSQEAWGSLIGAQKYFIPDMPHFTMSENILEFKELHNLIKYDFKGIVNKKISTSK